MKSLWNKVNRNNNDDADSTLIIFILMVPLLIVIMGFVTDLNKNVNARIAFATAAQESAQTSVRTVDVSGSLNNQTVEAFVDQYRYQVNPSEYHTNEIGAYQSNNCSTVTVNGVEHEAPYMVIRLETERGSDGSGSSEAWILEGPNSVPEAKDLSGSYRVISADVYDVSTNSWGVFGLPECQTHKSSVSAVAFGSNEDL